MFIVVTNRWKGAEKNRKRFYRNFTDIHPVQVSDCNQSVSSRIVGQSQHITCSSINRCKWFLSYSQYFHFHLNISLVTVSIDSTGNRSRIKRKMFEGRRSSINYVSEGDALGEGRAGKGVADFPIFGEGQEGRASGFWSINGALGEQLLRWPKLSCRALFRENE